MKMELHFHFLFINKLGIYEKIMYRNHPHGVFIIRRYFLYLYIKARQRDKNNLLKIKPENIFFFVGISKTLNIKIV